jgi:formylglycine-generating enzyme required for sulfatase activity
MHGNVWEWCSDRFGPYPDEEVVDPRGPEAGPGRVVRGGSWYFSPRIARSACRFPYSPEVSTESHGCRVVMEWEG